jgi:hypothetical protein
VPQGREGKGRERSKDASRTRHAFTKPTLEEVSAYCRERQNGIDPQGFIDHYESNGWMVGKVKMKDWRASVRTWEKNDHGQKSLPLKDDQQTQYLN